MARLPARRARYLQSLMSNSSESTNQSYSASLRTTFMLGGGLENRRHYYEQLVFYSGS
jgi:hypothetical protein